jgi:hypothetical protein
MGNGLRAVGALSFFRLMSQPDPELTLARSSHPIKSIGGKYRI